MGLFGGWEYVSKGTMDYARGGKLKISDRKLPSWLKKIRFPYTADVVFYPKGKTFRYKIVVTRPGEQGSSFLYKVYRKKRKK